MVTQFDVFNDLIANVHGYAEVVNPFNFTNSNYIAS